MFEGGGGGGQGVGVEGREGKGVAHKEGVCNAA